LKFEIEDIYMELTFNDFGGTDLSIDEGLSKERISKVTKWCEYVYTVLHGDGNEDI